jgi:tetratricopeptide (TPR) repeat protein
MFVAGNLDAAVRRVDESIAMLNSGAGRGVSRDRVFTTTLTFAQKLARENRPENAELINGLFDRAAVAATTPSQQVNYRLSRATLAKQNGRAAQQLKLYQEILSASSLRGVPVADADGNTRAAADVARAAIEELIRKDAMVYAEYEKSAAEMLQSASIAMNADQLQDIAATYPNSSAAPKALLSAAEIYESANNPREATQVLRRAYFRYPSSADSPRILEAMARNYLKMPNRLEVAIARLNQASDLRTGASPKLTRPLTLPDGRTIEGMSFVEAADALTAFRSQSGAKLPKLGLQPRKTGEKAQFLAERPNSAITDIDRLLIPAQEQSRNDRVITYGAASGIRVFAPGQQRPILTSGAFTTAPEQAAWVDQNLLAWNAAELAYIAEDGRLLWRATLNMLPKVDVVQNKTDAGSPPPAPGVINAPGNVVNLGDNQQIVVLNGRLVNLNPIPAAQPIAKPAQEQIKDVRVLADRVIVGTTDGRVIAIGLDAGKPLWQVQVGDHAANNLLASDDFVVARYIENPSSASIIVYDAVTGQVITRREFSADAGNTVIPANIALAPDGMLIYLLLNQIVGVDLFGPDALNKKETYVKTVDNSMQLQTAVDPDDLIINGDMMIVRATDPRGGSVVKVYKTRTGATMMLGMSDVLTRVEQNQLPSSFLIRANGTRIYVATPAEYRTYDVKTGKEPGRSPVAARDAVTLRDLILTDEFSVLLSEPSGLRARREAGAPTPSLRFQAYSRAHVDAAGTESALLHYSETITDPAGIVTWQIVNGGMYYTDSQQRLHYLTTGRE